MTTEADQVQLGVEMKSWPEGEQRSVISKRPHTQLRNPVCDSSVSSSLSSRPHLTYVAARCPVGSIHPYTPRYMRVEPALGRCCALRSESPTKAIFLPLRQIKHRGTEARAVLHIRIATAHAAHRVAPVCSVPKAPSPSGSSTPGRGSQGVWKAAPTQEHSR